MLRINNAEKHIYYIISTVVGIAMLGIPYIKYLVYVLPIMVILIAILLNCLTFNYNSLTRPFLFVILLSLLTVYEYDLNSIKKLLFIASYTSIFMFVDFSKVKIDFYYYGIVLFIIFAYQILIEGIYSQSGNLDYSIANSKSSFESSLSFPFAIISSFYILQSRWLLSLLYLCLVFLALKRIAIISVIVTFLAKIIPQKIRVVVLNKYIIIAVSLFLTFISIYFAYGGLDKEIKEIVNLSPNDLSKGRQLLWYSALHSLDYEFADYIVFGKGVGSVVTALQKTYGVDKILIHNDILAIYLEFGLVFLVLFLMLLMHHRTFEQQMLALGLTILFFTDNVIIYQHVMLTYLFAQSQFYRNTSKKLGGKKVVKV